MIPTPSLSHLKRSDFDKIYEPAEDTFALLDALEQDADRLRGPDRDAQGNLPSIVVEIG